MVSINNNIGGMRAHDALQQSHRIMQTSLERLSTGVRINRAEDDAAGLMLRDRFQAQMNGFEEAIRNIQTGMGMIQVAEQAINKVTDALQQIRSLAVRAADDNLNDGDRGRIQNQIKGLLREVNERASQTTYNGHKLLDGSIADSHAERQGSVKVQTTSFLANGNKMVDSAVVNSATAATTPNVATTGVGVSQGSYEIKLVFSSTAGNDQVDAVIYFSDARDDGGVTSSQMVPVSTLSNISGASAAYSAGGVSFTVNQSSSLNVGLTTYVKAYTYVSATNVDNSLQFQVGPDEGMITRVGIQKLDVETIFRTHNGDPAGLTNAAEQDTYDYLDVSVQNTLKSQDLIGQVDDALDFVGEENLKLGQFMNSFTRLLDLQRQNSTSITNAQANLNDADVATEATNQSKRMILVQSGTAMVAQANSTSQFLLQLLR